MKFIDFKGVKGWFIKTARSAAVDMGVWVYMVEGCVIDAGYTRACDQVLEHCVPEKPDALLITHAHEDHAGCAGPLIDALGIRMFLPPILKEALQKLQKYHLPFYRRFIWGHPKLPDWSKVSEGDVYQEGDARLRYIFTPGHSANHHVILDEKRNMVFTGDLYLGPRLTMAHPWEDPALTAKSLRKVRDMNPDTIFCAHRGMVRHPHTALSRKIEYIEWLVGRAHELADKGMTNREIANQLLGREKFISKITTGLYSRVNVINSILDGPKPEWPEHQTT